MPPPAAQRPNNFNRWRIGLDTMWVEIETACTHCVYVKFRDHDGNMRMVKFRGTVTEEPPHDDVSEHSSLQIVRDLR